MTTDILRPQPCSNCHGTGKHPTLLIPPPRPGDSRPWATPEVQPGAKPCTTCIGAGWTWTDGVAPTICPGGGKAPLINDPDQHPCGRREAAGCAGCDRVRAAIGTPADIERTIALRTARGDP